MKSFEKLFRLSGAFFCALVFIACCCNYVFGQCNTVSCGWQLSTSCGNITAVGGKCTGSPSIFCIGDTVCIEDLTTDNVDYTFICWNDGTPIQSFPGHLPGPISHVFSCPIPCLNSPPYFWEADIRLGVSKSCGIPNDSSFDFISIYVNIYFPPKVNFNLLQDTVCIDESVTINCSNICANSATPVYTWTDNGNVISTASCPSPLQFTTSGWHKIKLVLDNVVCGSASWEDSVYVFTKPTIAPIVNMPSLCYPTQFTINANANNAFGYLWSTIGNGSIVTPANLSSCTVNVIGPTLTVNLTVYGYGFPPPPAAICNTTWTATYNFQPGPMLDTISLIPDFCTSTFPFNLLLTTNYFNINPITVPSNFHWSVTKIVGAFPLNYVDTTSAPIPVSIPGPGTYVDSAMVWNNCDTLIIVDTFVVSTPVQVTVSPHDTTICENSIPFDLTSYGTPNGIGGYWSCNGITISPPVFNPDTCQQYCYWFVYHNGSTICPTTDSIEICIDGYNVSAGPDSTVCGNSSIITLGGTPSPGIWTSTSAGFIPPDSFDPILVASGSSHELIYTYSHQIYPGIVCTVTDTMDITVTAKPTAIINLPDSLCNNSSVILNATFPPGGSATWYLWSAGSWGGALSNGASVNPPLGIDSIKLIVTDAGGCSDTAYSIITVADPVTPTFSLSPYSGCDSLKVTFTNTSPSNPGTSFTWSLSNGTQSTGFNLADQYLHTNTSNSITIIYDTLWATNVCGSFYSVDSNEVLPRPRAIFGTSIGDSCSPATVNFANTSSGGTNTYKWIQIVNGVMMVIDNDSILGAQILIADTIDSVYYFLLVATNPCGVDTSPVQDIVIHPNETHAFMNTDVTFGCAPLTVTCIDFSSPGGSFVTTNFGDANNTTIIGDTVSFQYNDSGSFTIWHFVDGPCGKDSISQNINVFFEPDAGFVVKPVNCINELVYFNDTSHFWSGSEWWFGDGTDSQANPTSHKYNLSGFYTVKLVTHSNGPNSCTDTLEKIIQIVDAPTASFSILDNAGCAPFTVLLLSDSICNCTYNWDMGNSNRITGSPVSYTYNLPGSFTVTHTVIDNNNCQDTATFSYINVHPTPVASFQPEPMEQSINNPDFIFYNYTYDTSGFPLPSYLWTFGDGDSSLDFEPTHSYLDTGTYTVTLIVTNKYGCINSVSTEIIVEPDFSFFIPNSFTPNDDGINDVFAVQGRYIKHIRMKIFTRWGQLIYEESGVNPTWDGKYNGEKVQVGAYLYDISVWETNGKRHDRTKTLTVLQ